MAVDVLEYIVRLRGGATAAAEAKVLSRELGGVGKSIAGVEAESKAAAASSGRFSGVLSGLRKMALLGSGALIGVGFEATKMSTTFSAEMQKVHADAGASLTEVANMRKGILDLASSGRSLGAGPESLAKGLYHIESLGFRGHTALHALELAAQGAAISGADLEETTSALGAALFVGIKGTTGLDQIMGIMNATVGAGNMRMGELVHALGTGVLPAAKLAGLSIQDVMAALAVFSDSGQSASSAAAQFATALHFITNPTTKAQGALEQLHLTQTSMAEAMHGPKGMVGALSLLRDRLNALPGGMKGIKAGQVLGDIFPGGRGRVLQTELVMLDRATKKYAQIAHTSKNFPRAVQEQHHVAATQIREGMAKVDANMIRLGDVLGPFLVPILVKVTGALGVLVGWLGRTGAHVRAVIAWWKGLPAPIRLSAEFLGVFVAQGLAIFALVRIFAMVRAAILFVRTSILAMRGAIILLQMGSGPLMIGLMALVAVAILIATHWSQTKHLLVAAWHGIEAGAAWLWHGIMAGVNAVVHFVRSHWRLLLMILGGPFLALPIFVATHFHAVVRFIAGMPSRIAHAASGMWDGIKSAFKAAINWILGAWNSLHFRIGGWHIGWHGIGVTLPKVTVGMPHVPLLAQGGVARTRGAAIIGEQGPELVDLPAGATVTPLPAGGLGGGDIVLKVDGQTLARVLRRQILEAQARGA